MKYKSMLLFSAIRANNTVAATALIEQMTELEISQSDNMERTALHEAVDMSGYTALHYVASLRDITKVVKLLLDKMAPEAINVVDRWGNTALHAAAHTGNYEVVKLLLDRMTSETINAADISGDTALHAAARTGNYEVVKLLLDRMTSETINAVNSHEGKTALHKAVYNGKNKVVELLLDKMPPETVNAVDRDGRTALYVAASKGYPSIVELLLSAGADIPENVVKSPSDVSQEKINIIKTYLSVGTCVDKVYKGETLYEKTLITQSWDLFSSRLVSKIISYGIPKGCTDIKMHLENYAKFLSNELVESFMIKLVNKYLDYIYYKKGQGLPDNLALNDDYCNLLTLKLTPELLLEKGAGGYAGSIELLNTLKGKLPPAILDKFIAQLEDVREKSMLIEAGLIAQLNDGVDPTPLSLAIEKGINPTSLLSKTLEFYSKTFPAHAELIEKYKQNTLTPKEKTQLVKSLKNETGHYVAALINDPKKTLFNFMTSKDSEESVNLVKEAIKETLLQLSKCALPQDVKDTLQKFMNELKEAEHLAAAENPVSDNNLADLVAAIDLAVKTEAEGGIPPLGIPLDLENMDS